MREKHYFLIISTCILFSNFIIFPQNISHGGNKTDVDENIKFYLEKIVNKKQDNKKKLETSNSKKKFLTVLSITSFIILENIFIWNVASRKKSSKYNNISSNYKESENYKYLVDHKGNLNGIFLDLSSVKNPGTAYNDTEIKPVVDNLLDSIIFMFDITEETENIKKEFDEISSNI